MKKYTTKFVEGIEELVPRAKPVVVELLVAVAILVSALLMCGYDAMVVGNLIAFARPYHDTMSSIKEPLPADGSSAAETRKRDMFRNLTYWLIFVGVMTAETFVGSLARRVPFYVYAKPAFLVWFYTSDVLVAASVHAWERLKNAVNRTLLRSRDAGDSGETSTDLVDIRYHDRRQNSWYRLFFDTGTACWAFDPPTVAAVVLAGLLLCGFDRMVVGDLIGFLYSCHATVSLIKLPLLKDGARRTELLDKLTCWLIFAGVLFVEHNVGFLLRSLPYYLCIRTGILIWC